MHILLLECMGLNFISLIWSINKIRAAIISTLIGEKNQAESAGPENNNRQRNTALLGINLESKKIEITMEI